MDLDQYLSSPGALSVSELRKRMLALGYPVRSNAQIRQWRHKYSSRVPSPENCMGLELATSGAVRREDTRPDDWWKIWPELKGAPERQVESASVTDDVQPPTGIPDRERKPAAGQVHSKDGRDGSKR
ncbi:transcriptional regulator [Burkholderia multivorans]|uniref:transcriptional regulator n=1 Tax=Burkholderia multivorans TaxID=87883 RepID=UPI0015E30772|nr:YdaS family helix-turn-helix protein [Burkholderia multivorans]